MNVLCRLGLAASLVLLLTEISTAQVATGALTGIATDTTNARLPGVAVVLTNIDTGIAYRATTGDSGEYTLPLLPPGKYRLADTKTDSAAIRKPALSWRPAVRSVSIFAWRSVTSTKPSR